jgi:RNA polymerase sigma-70 factor, ECF subfamily
MPPAPAPPGPVDASLVRRARLGDADAFTAIVTAYYPRCLRFARGMLRVKDDAEDVVQEAFVRIFRALPRYEERQRFESWLFHILANVCRTANASDRRREARSIDEDDLGLRLASGDRTDASLDHGFGDEVQRALAEVPDYNREVFLLHYIEGFSYEEIERMTGVRQSALKMRVKRASDLLRRRLADFGSRSAMPAGGAE